MIIWSANHHIEFVAIFISIAEHLAHSTSRPKSNSTLIQDLFCHISDEAALDENGLVGLNNLVEWAWRPAAMAYVVAKINGIPPLAGNSSAGHVIGHVWFSNAWAGMFLQVLCIVVSIGNSELEIYCLLMPSLMYTYSAPTKPWTLQRGSLSTASVLTTRKEIRTTR